MYVEKSISTGNGLEPITVTALNIKDPELTERLSRLTADAQGQIQEYQADTARKNAARLRDYQRWALEQIRSVPTLDKLESGRVAKIASAIDRNNPLSQAREDANAGARDELVKLLIQHLSIVDLRLLALQVVGAGRHADANLRPEQPLGGGLDAARDADKKRVAEVGDRDADAAGFSGDCRAGKGGERQTDQRKPPACGDAQGYCPQSVDSGGSSRVSSSAGISTTRLGTSLPRISA